ncbi:MAG: class II fructose-bisphosphate aldolase [Chloroflexi bacterium]|jgi:fructose-bisphosphate aldolase class II|nr:class II fructose-bisphosphate aldolase [Chloroflexota bacterium]
MPLVSALPELIKAQSGGYAIPCFDTFEMLGTEGMFAAIEDKRAPTIVALYAHSVEAPNAKAFAAFIRTMAEKATVPVAFILDHGASVEQCVKALCYGLTDVMFDGSKLPLEENIANTRLVVQMAHAMGAAVEAELGHVGLGRDYSFEAQRKGFTDPAVAERFVEETGVDALAVAIGTAHGVYKAAPQLDLELLAEIKRRVSVPLVLHGGSGLSEEQFRAAIAGGIAKVNVFTDLGLTAGRQLVAAAGEPNASYFSMTDTVRAAFRARCGYYLDLFGASGKA